MSPAPNSHRIETPSQVRPTVVCVLAGIAGYALNVIQVPVFGGTSLVFGGIFGVLVAVAYGPWWGGVTAAIAFLQTVEGWGHYYGFPIFTLEAFVIGWLMHRRRLSVLRATSLYWLLLGLPLTYVLIMTQLRPPYPHNWAMVIKYPVNSLLVCLIVQVLTLTDRFWLIVTGRLPTPSAPETLRAHLFRRFLLTAAVPAAALAVVSVVTVNRQMRREAEVKLMRDGRQITAIISKYLQQHVHAIETAAQTLDRRSEPGESLDHLLEDLRRSNSGFLTMLIANERGAITAASPAIPAAGNGGEPLNVADRDYFRYPQPGQAAYISPIFRGRGFGRDLIIAVSASYLNKQGDREVIEGSLDLGKMREALLEAPALGGRQVVLVDNRSQVILSRDMTDNFATVDLHQLPTSERLNELILDDNFSPQTGDNTLYLGTWHQVPEQDWRLYLREPVWVSEAPVVRYLLVELACMLAALLLAYTLARFTARNLSQPFDNLVANAEAMALRLPGYQPTRMQGNVPLEWRALENDLSTAATRLAEAHAGLEEALAGQDRSNRELRQLTDELDERVRQRTAEAETARRTAEQASQVKSDFLAIVSHELRTPLNVILGNIYMLLRSGPEALAKPQADRVRRIQTSAQHLLGLINDILDLAKLEAGKIRINVAPVELQRLGAECEDFFREEVARTQLSFELKVATAVAVLNADKQRLLQILLNLISNALKFTPAGGRVGLEISDTADGEAIQFTVWDTGIGLSPEQQLRLFRPFEQVDRRLTREYAGAGLGLAIVMRLVKLHSGTVSLVSTPHVGSRFTVTIPKMKAVSNPPLIV